MIRYALGSLLQKLKLGFFTEAVKSKLGSVTLGNGDRLFTRINNKHLADEEYTEQNAHFIVQITNKTNGRVNVTKFSP